MREYKVIDDKKIRKSTRVIAVIAGLALIGVAIYANSIYSAIVGVIILLAMLLRKSVVINEEGLLTTYDAVFYKYRELWSFDEITDLHTEAVPDPQYEVLHVGKGIMVRRLVFLTGEVDKVIQLALEKNKEIHVDEAQ